MAARAEKVINSSNSVRFELGNMLGKERHLEEGLNTNATKEKAESEAQTGEGNVISPAIREELRNILHKLGTPELDSEKLQGRSRGRG